ncbi:MAG TPA: pyrroline-5-carboxylate reductase [Gammaproteobacteria bacterium]|nr:pyrroline-5-carboxylate reductase [Gammaproteobacteria bacterium]
MSRHTITLIGAGNMGASLLAGLIQNGFPAKQLWITDPDTEKLRVLQQQFAIHTTTDNEKAVKEADAVILAVKPSIISSVAESIAPVIQTKKPCVISIAAGIPEKKLQQWLGGDIAIVRCMPNTPALIGKGASALYANPFVNEEQRKLAESILRAVGIVVWLIDEKDMDAVTALSGSGPAYFLLMIELLQNIGESLGLSHETARLLTLQTALGTACMAEASTESARELRQRVTSKGGTTEAAIAVLEKENIRELFEKALNAACLRSKELANITDKENK